jgi:hypothetical protein
VLIFVVSQAAAQSRQCRKYIGRQTDHLALAGCRFAFATRFFFITRLAPTSVASNADPVAQRDVAVLAK